MAIRGDTAGLEKSYLLDMLAEDIACMLEIGCGDGRLTRKYLERARRVVSIDLPRALPEAGSQAKLDAVDVVAGSALALPFQDGCFDCALFSLSL